MRKLGGSDIPKLMGESKYGGPYEVYERVVLGVDPEWNPRMERGLIAEPYLRAYAQNHLGLELQTFDSDYFDHPHLEFARAQIDDMGVLDGMRVAVDYKTQNRFVMKNWGPEGSDKVPEQYRIQMAWELACSNRHLGLLIVGFGDDREPPEVFAMSHVIAYQIERDLELEARCIRAASDFWTNHVIPQIPPPQTAKQSRRKAKAS